MLKATTYGSQPQSRFRLAEIQSQRQADVLLALALLMMLLVLAVGAWVLETQATGFGNALLRGILF